MNEHGKEKSEPYRVLCLDGGGTKAFYTLGVLKEIESLYPDKKLCEVFDLIYGVSTGAIIASLLALGKSVDEIREIYRDNSELIFKRVFSTKRQRSLSLKKSADKIFKDLSFENVKTSLGIIASDWDRERIKIFKSSVSMAHGRKNTFRPGFGFSLSDVIQGSCSAYPFFQKKKLENDLHSAVLVDGGFCANNPTFIAIIDALSLNDTKGSMDTLRVLSLGVGRYAKPKDSFFKKIAKGIGGWELLEKTLEWNAQTTEAIRKHFCKEELKLVRVDGTHDNDNMAMDFSTYDPEKFKLLFKCGRSDFGNQEKDIKELLG